MKRQRNSYMVKEKSKVKQFSQDSPLQKSSQRVGSGCHALFSKEEAQLYEWIMELRKDGFTVNHSSIKMKMVEIMRSSARLAQDEAEKWMANGGNGLTKGGNLKRADLNTVCHWVLNAWDVIFHDIIIWTFKKYSISNCLSGSEDHLIYKDDRRIQMMLNSSKDIGEDIGKGLDENTNTENDFNNWPECFVVI
ncbi:7117_t:CDS:2 [Cetraspora pellucida]|uniref:7117_t:CDS:1 n=1 Tax=Cetraspora pellucida TaxID=1433469 RepID=A0A9N9N7H2_9GLOM|nr:7117_t:CDS:2 [Cetraspora pellucida]